jgi:hypothetical protein
MFKQYSNIDQIKSARKSITAQRIPELKSSLFKIDMNQTYIPNTNIITNDQYNRIELHAYSDETWISGNHKIQFQPVGKEYRDKITNQLIRINQPIGIDIYNEFENLKITSGTFRIVLNFFKNLIGNFERQHLRIDEISPDRKEIRLIAIDETDSEFLSQITNYIETVNQTSDSGLYKSYLLNFGRNQCVHYINSVVIGQYVYVKLQDALPEKFEIDFKCWLVEEQKAPYVDQLTIQPAQLRKQFNRLSNPNWQAFNSYDTSTDTGLKNWNDLLGSSVETSQQIVDKYFSGSLSGMTLNIDYSDFNNFVFYSSATERFKNFKYKLGLIEYYTAQSSSLENVSGSAATTNQQDYNSLKRSLIGGFDNFEKYLYYESSSLLTTHDIPVIDATVPQVTGSYIQPTPKSNSTVPYALYSISSSQFVDWYNTIYESASLYDNLNRNSLALAVPDYLSLDSKYDQVTTFINMLGQHYDILYTYINNMTRINKREENTKLGMPNELLYSVAKQFGWNLTNGNQNKELWQYAFGVNETGTPLTGSNTVGDPSVSAENITYSVWRRIVNNLPLLLKSKGTKRSIRALLSCYGIPQSFITINEYGGPRIERAPVYEKLNFDYSLDLINNTAGTVTVNYDQPIESVELRFRTDDVIKNPTLPNTMNLFTIGSNTVTLDYTSGTLGTIQINGVDSNTIELFDGGWLTAVLRKDGSNLEVVAKKSKYGKIVAAVSASDVAAFASSGTLTLGGTTGGNRLQGQLQELRLWTSSLQDSAFNNHVKAPAAYDGNVSAFDELVFRVPLTQKIDHALTGSLIGVEPNASGISASFASWTNDTPYDSLEETYYYDGISLGAGTYDDNKIRLEDNELIGELDVKTRAERSQYDKAPLDSNKLGVYFSPQTMIDEDIIAQLGFTSLDDYIGDPGDINAKSYPDLIHRARDYWKKYIESNDVNAYINMFTLFDLSFFKQLDQLLPARVNKLTGVLVQPNILERSKDTILPTVERFNNSYNVTIQDMDPTASADYPYYIGAVKNKIAGLNAIDDDQYQMYLTASEAEKYNGTTYSYDYLIRSGSTYVTASSPYWRSEGLNPTIIDSVLSEIKEIVAVPPGEYGGYSYGAASYNETGSIQFAQVQDYLPTGVFRQRYDGSKLTSADFNIQTTQTVDGGAPVEVRKANPNQLIYQDNGEQGSFVLVR